MAINAKNTAGWLVLAVGLILIAITINTTYSYFTGKQEFPRVFKFDQIVPKVEAQITDEAKKIEEQRNLDEQLKKLEEMRQSVINSDLNIQGGFDPQIQVQDAVNQALNNILPAGIMEKMMNMIAWSVFATFLVYAGAKISEIGIKMIA